MASEPTARDVVRAHQYVECTVGAVCAVGFICNRHLAVAKALADERERAAEIFLAAWTDGKNTTEIAAAIRAGGADGR